MKTQQILSLTVTAAVAITFAANARAEIIQFQDLSAWQAAVGPIGITEDFNGFSSDTSFRVADGPLALAGGMSIVEVGTTQGDLNKVDVSPFNVLPPGFVFPVNGVDGTPFALGATDALNATVELSFATPITAFGADFVRANGGEGLNIDVFGNGGMLLGTLNPNVSTTFVGFQADAGEFVDLLVFRSGRSLGVNNPFGMDNIRIRTIPEPSSMMMVGFGAVALIGRVACPRLRGHVLRRCPSA